MRTANWLWRALLLVPLALAGCKDATTDRGKASGQAKDGSGQADDRQDEEAEIQAALAQLDPPDRKLAEQQNYCAVMSDSRLGSMGAPFKVLVKDEPVFLCCKGCQKKALANPDKSLAKARELRAKAAGAGAKRNAAADQPTKVSGLRIPEKGI
jgi:hypothetical protein